MSRKKSKRASSKRIALTILCVVLALVLTALLGGTIYAKHLLGQMNRIDQQETQPTMSVEELNAFLESEIAAEQDATEEDSTESTAPTVNEEDVVFEEHDTQIGGEDTNIINILLIGQDRRANENYRTRSDTMILCTFNKDTKTLTLTSFLRDLYVQIPGYYKTKINAAYVAGGMSLLNQTLEENFGIHVDGNVEVDFSGFADVIDLLGGVEIDLRNDEASYINYYLAVEQGIGGSNLTGGLQKLNGEQALMYARIRALDADADFSRTNRQRKLINALVEKYKGSKLTDILGILEDVLPMITTDLTDAQIVSYATELFPLLAETTIVSQRIPADGEYQFATINGAAVILADMNAARELLEQTIGEGSTAEAE